MKVFEKEVHRDYVRDIQRNSYAFEPGTVITSPAFVVDMTGKAWWVEPATQAIKEV